MWSVLQKYSRFCESFRGKRRVAQSNMQTLPISQCQNVFSCNWWLEQVINLWFKRSDRKTGLFGGIWVTPLIGFANTGFWSCATRRGYSWTIMHLVWKVYYWLRRFRVSFAGWVVAYYCIQDSGDGQNLEVYSQCWIIDRTVEVEIVVQCQPTYWVNQSGCNCANIYLRAWLFDVKSFCRRW